MPYRENNREPFHGDVHVQDAVGKSYVRKTVIENDKKLHREAGLRNHERNWFEKLVFQGITGVDVAHEEALKMHLQGLRIESTIRSQSNILPWESLEDLKIIGEFDGLKTEIVRTGPRQYEGYVGKEQLDGKQARRLFKRLLPLLEQREKDKVAAAKREQRRAK